MEDPGATEALEALFQASRKGLRGTIALMSRRVALQCGGQGAAPKTETVPHGHPNSILPEDLGCNNDDKQYFWESGKGGSFTIQKDAEQIHGEIVRGTKIIRYFNVGLYSAHLSQTRCVSSASTTMTSSASGNLKQVVPSLCRRTQNRSIARSSAAAWPSGSQDAFSCMKILATAGWSIYPLGYFCGYLSGAVDETLLIVVCNVAD